MTVAANSPKGKKQPMQLASISEVLDTPIAGEYDVVVAGGGASGLIAAVAAARAGAKTLLVERQGCLGGTATTAYVAQFIGFFNHGVQAVWGLPFEYTKRIKAAGGSPGFNSYVLAEASASPLEIHNFPFNPEVVKYVADEWVGQVGVDVRLHTSVVRALVDGSRLTGLVVEDVGGRSAYRAKVFVDATGDATVAKHAGVKMQDAEGGQSGRESQPHSLVFRLSNVDVKRFRSLPREEKREIAMEGVRNGELFWESLSFMSTPGGTDAISLMSRIRGLDALDPQQATEIELEGRRQVRSILAFLNRRVPGFERAILASIAPRTGIRETRRILGTYTLTERDILDGRTFQDSVALGCGPVDLHDADGTGIRLHMPSAPFEIPMRCLLPTDLDSLIVTGRAISATRGANGGARHMATAMALGQAAGSMAIVACGKDGSTRSLSPSHVQEVLSLNNAAFDREQCLARSAAAEV